VAAGGSAHSRSSVVSRSERGSINAINRLFFSSASSRPSLLCVFSMGVSRNIQMLVVLFGVGCFSLGFLSKSFFDLQCRLDKQGNAAAIISSSIHRQMIT